MFNVFSTVAEVVVDSGSADGSWEVVDQIWDKARTVRFEENIGFCAGCNRGAEAAAPMSVVKTSACTPP